MPCASLWCDSVHSPARGTRTHGAQVLVFLASWLVLLGRFSVLNFKHDDGNETEQILPSPATSYVNNIGCKMRVTGRVLMADPWTAAQPWPSCG